MHCIMYKYTYIHAAGGKRITKNYKVRLLTIAGERAIRLVRLVRLAGPLARYLLAIFNGAALLV